MGFTIAEMAKQLRRLGESSAVLNMYSGGKPIAESEITKAINQTSPEYICWLGADGWNYYTPLSQTCASKINLWFDDPIMRTVDKPKVQEAMIKGAKVGTFSVFCWDSYWSNKLKQVLGVDCKDIHLSADNKNYFCANRKLSDDAVFIGNLHSPKVLYGFVDTMPEIFQVFINQAMVMVKGAIGNIPSWDMIMQMTESVLDSGDVEIWGQHCLQYPQLFQAAQSIIWQLSKNHARIKMLRQAKDIFPVRMFTETKQRNHATIDELKGMIGEWNEKKFKIVETSEFNQETLGHLYHYGRLHLQATDPQSVHSGVPYRVFQCAASGRPLLTDWRTGWGDLFEKDKDLLTYEADKFGEAFEKAVRRTDLDEIGFNAALQFNAKHTWTHRLDTIKKGAMGDTWGTNMGQEFMQLAQRIGQKAPPMPV